MKPKIKDINRFVYQKTGLDINKRKRTEEYVNARFTVIYFLFKKGYSKSAISKNYNLNFSTVINAIKKFEYYRLDQEELYQELQVRF